MDTKQTFFSNKQKVREMTLLAMFIAIILVMGFVPWLGFIQIGTTSITLIHIPVLIGSIIMGRKGGMVLGLTFGLTSFLRALTSVGLDYIFIFPWVSILPRFVFGLLIYDVYRLLYKLIKSRIVTLIITFGLMTFIHTLMVLPLMIASFPLALNLPAVTTAISSASDGEEIIGFMQGVTGINTIYTVIKGVIISNGIIEASIAASIGAIVADRLIAILRREEKNNHFEENSI